MQEVTPITYAFLIGGAGGIISLLFWRYIASLEKRLTDCDESRKREVALAEQRVTDAQKQRDQAWQLLTALGQTFATEAEKDRTVLKEISAAINPARSRR